MRSNTATREFFVGLPGLGQTRIKIIIECGLATGQTSEGKTGFRPLLYADVPGRLSSDPT